MADIAATARAITFAKSGKTVFGNKRVSIGTITLVCNGSSDTVPAAGLNLVPADVGLRGIDIILFETKSSAWIWDGVSVIRTVGTGAGSGLSFAVGGAGVIPTANEAINFIAIGYGTK